MSEFNKYLDFWTRYYKNGHVQNLLLTQHHALWALKMGLDEVYSILPFFLLFQPRPVYVTMRSPRDYPVCHFHTMSGDGVDTILQTLNLPMVILT